MTPEQKAAYIFAQAVAAMADIEAMKAMNTERERNGYALAYDENAFFAVADRYVISHNAILNLFQDGPHNL